ncbi:50S ribosomal protein L4 [Frigoribacterium sp. PhB24]|uniref:50S ribosomal protein L4 n=1 Tax=Frigoribacterium sp. PhB24 TaxID=2485204 RepID=UPI000F4A9D19|nr:50S ribosomal protein L4 [Frigoribacterium sp. PhB24]ROS50416.1 LSU ribosomal protein L4P [Frigoribacterium sp. PhB24]
MATTTAPAASVDVVDAKGKKTSTVELPVELFDVVTNVPLIHQVVVAQQAAARQGTHKTKRRGEVSGAGRKPFKQKGTGRARQGSIRAPQMTGGGIVHGPQPRDYAQRTPKKMIAAALLGALSDRARGARVHVVESFVADSISTKVALELLASIASSKHVLIVTDRDDTLTLKSVRNVPTVHVITFDQLNAYDVLVSDDIVFTKSAFDGFVASKAKKEATA